MTVGATATACGLNIFAATLLCRSGAELRLLRPSGGVMRVLELLGINQMLVIYESLSKQ